MKWRELEFLRRKPDDIDEIGPGEIGFIVTGIKDLSDTKVGDTITTATQLKMHCQVLNLVNQLSLWIISIDSTDYSLLKDSLVKLKLNDSKEYEPENSNCSRSWF